jgi:polar amino acid transport system substrate-binding protein
MVQKNAGYIAFSKDHSDDEIAQWQQALDKLKRSGKYDELVQNYLH